MFFYNEYEKLKKKTSKPCKWSWDDTLGSFDTGCGNSFSTLDEGPKECTWLAFCPFCGKPVKMKVTK